MLIDLPTDSLPNQYLQTPAGHTLLALARAREGLAASGGEKTRDKGWFLMANQWSCFIYFYIIIYISMYKYMCNYIYIHMKQKPCCTCGTSTATLCFLESVCTFFLMVIVCNSAYFKRTKTNRVCLNKKLRKCDDSVRLTVPLLKKSDLL